MQEVVNVWNWIYSNQIAFSLLAVISMLIAGFISSLVCKFFLRGIVRRFILHSHKQTDHDKEKRITRRLSNVVPVVTIYFMLQLINGLPNPLVEAIRTICGVLFIINITMLINELLDTTINAYTKDTARRPGR